MYICGFFYISLVYNELKACNCVTAAAEDTSDLAT